MTRIFVVEVELNRQLRGREICFGGNSIFEKVTVL